MLEVDALPARLPASDWKATNLPAPSIEVMSLGPFESDRRLPLDEKVADSRSVDSCGPLNSWIRAATLDMKTLLVVIGLRVALPEVELDVVVGLSDSVIC